MSDTKISPKRPPLPFRWKLALGGSLLAIVPLSVAGWLLVDINASAVELSARELQLAVADDLARTVEESEREVHEGLEAIGRVLIEPALDGETTERLAANLLSSSEYLDNAAVYDRHGVLIDVLAEETAEDLAVPDPLPAELRSAADGDDLATGPAIGRADAPARFPVVLPLRLEDTITGYIAAWVSVAPLQARVARLNEVRFADHRGSVFLVDQDHRLLAHPDPELAAALTSVSGEGILEGLATGLDVRRLQKSGEFEGADGEPMVGTVVGLRVRPWAVVVQVPQSVAYASVTKMRMVVLGTLAGVLLVALLLAIVAALHITRPIEQLTAFAGQLAERRFDTRVTIDSRDELAVLGQVMSNAAADLEASEARIKEEVAIRSDLGRYLPAELVEQVVERKQDMALGGRRRDVTVLFADVVAFTPLTGKLPAEDVVALLNELFTILTEIVFRHRGTVDKFVGDCVMALWGAPRADEDHAANALAAAEDMMRFLEVGNERWKKRFGVTIELAIGVHTGSAVIGNIGSETRMEYTAIGDTVNVAARLESIAGPMQILISSQTRDAAEGLFDFVEVGSQTFPGRSQPVELWEVRL
ncbi:MAG: HAMP domain-containing protein [Deltaproteobacteria bacterium]|nr:HAMP domain-containing protein [Deltaproteobacteria bacterium]